MLVVDKGENQIRKNSRDYDGLILWRTLQICADRTELQMQMQMKNGRLGPDEKFLRREFKGVALRKHDHDDAVGMIISSAFTSVVDSLVNDISMPVLNYFHWKIDFPIMFIALDEQIYPTLA